MPRHTAAYKRTMVRRRRQGGMGFFSSLLGGIKKLGSFLHKHKVISRAGKVLGSVGVPYASDIGGIAKTAGWGRRRRRRVGRPRKGYGLARAGGALRRAGAGRRRRKTTYP